MTTPASTASGRGSRRSTGTVTLSDVAKVAEVSQQTVSRAIRTPLQVSPSTLQRVEWAIGQTGYVPNQTASSVATNRTLTVAAIIPVISVSIFADAMHELEDVLATSGYQILLGITNYSLEHEEQLVRTFLSRRPDGFFVLGTDHTPATTTMLKNARVPVVETWDMNQHPIDCLVGFSNADSIAAMVRHVVERGYSRPTFAGARTDFRSTARIEGFTRAMHELLPNQPVRGVEPLDAALDMDAGKAMLHEMLARFPDTDVLVCSSDNYAAGALLECLRLGIKVPETLAITGFGDFEMSRHLVPGLTSVATPHREIGRRSGEMLVQSLAGQRLDTRIVDLGFTVVARASA